MAARTMTDRTGTTAPALLGMDTRGAKVLAAALIGTLVASTIGDVRGVSSVSLLWASIVVASLGVVGMLAIKGDPMPAGVARAVASTGLLACVCACLALPGEPVNANQTNALGASVAVCAFLCVRGRTPTAWFAMAAMVGVFAAWAERTGQGALSGLLYVAPNVAVVGMATLFAVIMRPAAADIQRLREVAIAQAAQIAATEARLAERDRRRCALRELAWPTLEAVASSEAFSAKQAAEVKLTERRLRDSVRARFLNVPAVVDAAWEARARGVDVVMFDDSGMNASSVSFRDEFCRLAAEWLTRTTEGTVTVRIHPPGRSLVGSIVAVAGDGTSQRAEMELAGRIHRS
jgi:hypothetical protein